MFKIWLVLCFLLTALLSEWNVKTSISEITGKKRCFVKTNKLISDDGNYSTTLNIGTNGERTWIYFFSMPGLELKNEFSDSKVLFDDTIEEISMFSKDNESMVVEVNGKQDIKKIIKYFKRSNNAVVEFEQKINGKISFNINLKGFSKAFNNAKQMCKIKKISKKTKKFNHPAWTVNVTKDSMTGEKQCSIHSKLISPTLQMDFPYENIKSSISVNLYGKNIIYSSLYFTVEPNLLDESLVGKTYASTRRVKFDDKIEKLLMLHKPGSKFVNLPPEERLLKNFKKHKSFMTEFEWYGNEMVRFKHNISNFEEALNNARYKCGMIL